MAIRLHNAGVDLVPSTAIVNFEARTQASAKTEPDIAGNPVTVLAEVQGSDSSFTLGVAYQPIAIVDAVLLAYKQNTTLTLNGGEVIDVTFGTGDGVTPTFTLPSSGAALSIYRTDWQGKQLLYSTSRTNIVPTSEWQIANLSQNTGTPAVVNTTLTIPGYGTVNALSFPVGVTANKFCAETSGVTAGQVISMSAVVQMSDNSRPTLGLTTGTGDFCFRSGNTIAANGTIEYQDLGNNIWRVMLHGTVIPGNGSYVGLMRYTGQGAKGMVITCFQHEVAPVCGPYIKTTGAMGSVTDYSIAGNLITFGQTPLLGAQLSCYGAQGTDLSVKIKEYPTLVRHKQQGNVLYTITMTLQAESTSPSIPVLSTSGPRLFR